MQQRFLLIQTAFIGDVVLATALLEDLHAAYPDALPDVLVRKGNEDLFRDHPFVANVLVWDKQQRKIPHLLQLLATIRRNHYQKVINVQRYSATGLLTALSGASERVGFDKNPLSFLFTRRARHEFGDGKHTIHETERNRRLIDHLVPQAGRKPKLYPSDSDEAFIARYTGQPFITISPASVWFTKQYPPQKWAAFLDELGHRYVVYLLGGPGDRSLADAVIQMTGSVAPHNLCGELSYLQSVALMKHAVMNFVNDSAPMHFASAVNAPVAVVYCSTIPGFGYGPLSDIRHVIEHSAPLYCRPCGLHGHAACPEGHFRCALEISPQQLLASLAI